MLNSKILQFENTIMKVIEMSKNDGVPEAALYLALQNAINSVSSEMARRVQEEREQQQNMVAGEPIVEPVNHPETNQEGTDI